MVFALILHGFLVVLSNENCDVCWDPFALLFFPSLFLKKGSAGSFPCWPIRAETLGPPPHPHWPKALSALLEPPLRKLLSQKLNRELHEGWGGPQCPSRVPNGTVLGWGQQYPELSSDPGGGCDASSSNLPSRVAVGGAGAAAGLCQEMHSHSESTRELAPGRIPPMQAWHRA
jgi:hypothetical protein